MDLEVAMQQSLDEDVGLIWRDTARIARNWSGWDEVKCSGVWRGGRWELDGVDCAGVR